MSGAGTWMSEPSGCGRPSVATRLLALAGVVGPVFFVLVFTIDGSLHPGYSPIRQKIIELGVGQDAWIFNDAGIVFGLLLMLFAIGFYRGMRPVIGGKWATSGLVLILLSAAGLVNNGLFNVRDYGLVHAIWFLVLFGSLIFMLFLMGRRLRKVPDWRGYGRYSTAAGIVTLSLFVAVLVFAQLILRFPLPPGIAQTLVALNAQAGGLLERLLVVEAFAWYVVTGWRLFTLGSPLDR